MQPQLMFYIFLIVTKNRIDMGLVYEILDIVGSVMRARIHFAVHGQINPY